MVYTSPNLSEKNLQEAMLNVYKTNRDWLLGVREKETVQQKCAATDLTTYMGGIIEIVLEKMIQGFLRANETR